jgi:hypothetical protein
VGDVAENLLRTERKKSLINDSNVNITQIFLLKSLPKTKDQPQGKVLVCFFFFSFHALLKLLKSALKVQTEDSF